MSSKIKNILIVIVIGAVLYFVYYYFFSNKTPEQPLLSSSSGVANPTPGTTAGQNTTTTGSTDQVGKDFLALLLNIKTIRIEDGIFSDPAFVGLRDSSIEIINDGTNQGRPNPFAPIGSDLVNTSFIDNENTPSNSNTNRSSGNGSLSGTSTQ